jgi:hypothetical protein
MLNWLNRKVWNKWVSPLVVVVLALSAVPTSAAQAQPQKAATPAPVVVALNKGWAKFSWVPLVRGPLAFTALFISPDNTANLTLPALLTFTTSAQVNCPRTSADVVVNVKVYDFKQLILAMPYTVSCARRAQPLDPTVRRTADDYLNDPHYLQVSVPIATGGAHNLVVQTDLATQDSLFWGYVRADTAPGVAPASTSRGAIAVTAINPPATAWAGVQWGDPSGAHWFNVEAWFGALNQTDGRMAFWVDVSQFGTGPYRWVIYDQDPAQGGQLWGVSDPFMFPRTAVEWVWVKVTKSAAPIK